ncbi:MAG: hypothetical protein HF973_05190 [Chloroflexi bacterium]|nr:hypothetical protein [Chloroflexota bacterium]
MSVILIVKILIVLVFLVIFLRRPSIGWGIGLLTVTLAVLLDTIMGTFDPEQLQAQLGFFFYIFAGVLLGGMIFWILSVLRPYLPLTKTTPTKPAATETSTTPQQPEIVVTAVPLNEEDSPYDQQMLYEQIQERFSREDVLDLMFDLEINENDVLFVGENMDQLIRNIMNTAVQRSQMSALALAVERSLTPPPPDTLPRLEKINAASPPTVLRHYLLAYYDLEQLRKMTTALGIDWEQIGFGNKKTRVRELLLYLYRRNRVAELIDLMQESVNSNR